MSPLDLDLNYLPRLPRRKDFRIGCIGAGFIMRDCHLVAYRQAGFNPVAIASRTADNARAVAAQHRLPCYYEQIDQLLRQLRFKPEEHVDTAGRDASERRQVEQLIEEKRAWLRAEVPPERLAERHAALARINTALENYVSKRRTELGQERQQIEAELRRGAILDSREFSFCLYPEEGLRPWLLDGAAQAI